MWTRPTSARGDWQQLGALDEEAIRAWRRARRLVDPDLVLDIGCNYGEVLLSTSYAAEVHAFEPNPSVTRRLKRSLGKDVTLHEAAVPSGVGLGTSVSLERTWARSCRHRPSSTF